MHSSGIFGGGRDDSGVKRVDRCCDSVQLWYLSSPLRRRLEMVKRDRSRSNRSQHSDAPDPSSTPGPEEKDANGWPLGGVRATNGAKPRWGNAGASSGSSPATVSTGASIVASPPSASPLVVQSSLSPNMLGTTQATSEVSRFEADLDVKRRLEFPEGMDPSVSARLQQLADKNEASIATALRTASADFNRNMAVAITALEKSNTERFSAVHREVDDVKKRTLLLEDNQKTMRDTVRKLEALVGAATSPSPLPAQYSLEAMEDDRLPNPTIIRISAAAPVQLEEAEHALRMLTTEADIPVSEYQVTGSAKKFTVAFLGVPNRGALLVNKVLALSRFSGPGGKWRELTAGAAGARIFLNPDQSPKTDRMQAAARVLRKTIREAYPHIDLHVARDDGIISIDWQPVARIVTPSPSEVRVEWVVEIATKHNIDSFAVGTAFQASFVPRGRPTWPV